jgi:lipoprotein-releasing system permease protein
MADKLAALPDVLRAAPVIAGQAGVLSAKAFSGVQIYGVAKSDLESLKIVREAIVAGGIDDFGKGDQGGDSILIGQQLANRMGLFVGDAVTLISPSNAPTLMGPSFRRKTYHVGAIFNVGMSMVDDVLVYMPIEQARIFLGHGPTYAADYIEITIANPDDVDAQRPKIDEALGGQAVLGDWRDNYQSYFTALGVERNVMRLIMALLVVLAQLTIICGLLMLAKNKSSDIAILRTMGATRGSILRIFLTIGATIGALGTLAGLVIGILFCVFIGDIQHGLEWLLSHLTGSRVDLFNSGIYFLSQIPARPDAREIAFIALWGFGTSCVAALLPAWNAARLDPVEALRYG